MNGRGAVSAARWNGWALQFAAGLAGCCCGMLQADEPAFSGRVVVELVEELGNDHKLRVLEDFAFRDEQGREWRVPKGALLDGWTLPRDLRGLPNLPLESEFRKSAVVHDHFSQVKTERWRDVHRMLYSASVAEGLPPMEAKMLYMTIYASGWRWEPRGSTCYGSCHAGSPLLTWRPDATPPELGPVADWLQKSDPTLEEIEQQVDAALQRPGPHLFTQLRR